MGLLILPNFVFAVLGLALVLSGAYLQVAHKESFNFIHNVPTPILLIAVGSAVFLVSFMACRGAGRSSTFLLNFLSFVYVDDVAAGISKYGKAALDNYKVANHEGVT